MYKIGALLAFLAITFGLCKAQVLQRSTIGSTGNSISSSGVMVRQSIGQPSNTLVFSNNITLRQGFQQPGQFHFAYINPQVQEISFSLSPNPLKHTTALQVHNALPEFTIVLSSFTGQVFGRYASTSTKYMLDCIHLPDGVYLVSIVVNDVVVGVEKLVKKK